MKKIRIMRLYQGVQLDKMRKEDGIDFDVLYEGSEYDVPEWLAEDLVERGFAGVVGPVEPEPKPEAEDKPAPKRGTRRKAKAVEDGPAEV